MQALDEYVLLEREAEPPVSGGIIVSGDDAEPIFTVVSVGKDVTNCSPGDQVVVYHTGDSINIKGRKLTLIKHYDVAVKLEAGE